NDTAKIRCRRAISDTGSDCDGDFIGVGFTDRFRTSRTITRSQRNAGSANDAQGNTETGRIKLASRERHCSFNANYATAASADDFSGWRNAGEIAAREIQISGAKVSAAQDRTDALSFALSNCNIDIVTKYDFKCCDFDRRQVDQAGKEGTKARRKERVEARA